MRSMHTEVCGDMQTAMAVASKWKEHTNKTGCWETDSGAVYAGPTPVDEMFRYYGNPVFTFHDFNLLRKRPSLNTLTHVQYQADAFRLPKRSRCLGLGRKTQKTMRN